MTCMRPGRTGTKSETLFFHFQGKSELIVVVKELVSVEEPVGVVHAPSVRFARFGNKINIDKSC